MTYEGVNNYQNEMGSITYGPHMFPDPPEFHIRIGDLTLKRSEAHSNIKNTLIKAFRYDLDNSIVSRLSKTHNIKSPSSINISFLNYGNTEIVYLVTMSNNNQFTVLINQPHTKLGVVRDEFNNLERLMEMDSRFVVKPLAYFSNEDLGHELYASEYIKDAACIIIGKSKHGIYLPIATPPFKVFPSKISSAINSTMIALLVNYYDEQKGRGLAQIQTNGNDYMLKPEFEIKDKSTILPNIKLIAARKFIDTTLDEYLNLLQSEFLISTEHGDKLVTSGKILINTRSSYAMTKKQINKGIELGLKLRRERLMLNPGKMS